MDFVKAVELAMEVLAEAVAEKVYAKMRQEEKFDHLAEKPVEKPEVKVERVKKKQKKADLPAKDRCDHETLSVVEEPPAEDLRKEARALLTRVAHADRGKALEVLGSVGARNLPSVADDKMAELISLLNEALEEM